MIDSMDFASRIAPIPEAHNVFVKATIYGESGVGKTRLALTRTAGKVLVGNIEDGYLSLAGSGLNKVDLRAHRDFQALYLFLKAHPNSYDTVFVDTFTEAQKWAVTEIADEKARNRQSKDPDKISLEDYGLATQRVRRWLWDMRSLPIHVFYICLAKPVLREGEVAAKWTLAVTQKLGEALLAYSDLVAYMALAQVKRKDSEELVTIRRLYLQPSVEFDAKARMPVGRVAPAHINQPTLDKIIALYRGETSAPKEAQ